MPNHYTTKLKIKGPKDDLTQFKVKHLTTIRGEQGELCFDFSTVIHKPYIIDQTEASSLVDDGLAVMEASFAKYTLDEYLTYPWVKKEGITTKEGLKKALVERNPDCLNKAIVAIEAYKQTGFCNWYDWSIANWGTKWNAYNLQITCDRGRTLNLSFDTAWAPPIPVLVKLIEMWPSLTFEVAGRDECERAWTNLNEELAA